MALHVLNIYLVLQHVIKNVFMSYYIIHMYNQLRVSKLDFYIYKIPGKLAGIFVLNNNTKMTNFTICLVSFRQLV